MTRRRARRALAALLAATGTALALLSLHSVPHEGRRVHIAARDLPAGRTLTATDISTVELPSSAVPDGLARAPLAGRTVAGPMRRGEPFTDARLLGEGLLRGHAPGTVAAPVRIADAEAARLLRPGDRIDVLAGAPPADDALAPPRASARLVATAIPVLSVPPPREDPHPGGALIVLAADRSQALALAAAGPALTMTITAH
ncbi:SAF domain-containing protein [Actinomadura hibisca]|uniref:SAF domain-containing protein n=1 Tax=Actinomadura hibisca TaxID=68565 RepID=UPI0008369591|nr:SAF domain-containing protein [Actinomadura hibisca]